MIGNKMTSLNLATIFGPNLLHKQKSSEKEFSVESSARMEDSAAIISVVQLMIDTHQSLFTVHHTRTWPYDWDMRMLSQRKYNNKNKSPLLWLFVMTVLWKCLRCSLCQHSPLACPKKGCWDDLDHLSLNEGQVCLQNRNMQGFLGRLHPLKG